MGAAEAVGCSGPPWDLSPTVAHSVNTLDSSEPSASDALHALIESSQDIVVVIDSQGLVVRANSSACSALGAPIGSIVGAPIGAWVPEGLRDGLLARFREVLDRPSGGGSLEFDCPLLSTEEKQPIPAVWRLSLMKGDSGRPIRILCSIEDRREIEELARRRIESDTRLRALLRGLLDPVITIDGRGKIVEVGDSTQEMFGYGREELLGENIRVLMPEPHRSAHDGYLENYRKTGDTWILDKTRRFQVVHRSGRLLWCELSVSRVDIPGDPEPLFTGSFRDVTARVEAEESLAESERRVRAIFNQEFQYVGLLDAEGRMLEANSTALEAIGRSLGEVQGTLFWETPWWSHSVEEQARVRDAVRRAAGGEFVRFEAQTGSRGGALLDLDFSLKPIRGEGGEVVFLLPEGRDISLIKRTQRAETGFLRTLASLGESAAVLAHEIRSPITAINQALRAVAERLGTDDVAVLDELVGRLRKLEAMLQRTLSFGKPLQLVLERTDLVEVVEGLLPPLEAVAREAGIRIEREFPDRGRAWAMADASHVEEVLQNLIQNGIEALAEGGVLRITVEPSGSMPSIRIDDDGPGVPLCKRDRIFELFQTSKDVGTGIGLAVSRKIIDEHGGKLTVSDSPLGGARFTVALPSA